MHRRRFRFPPPLMSEEGESLRRTRWIIQRQDDLLEISRREKEMVSMGFASHVKSCVGNAHIIFTDGTPKVKQKIVV